jgi:hypothetical protein
VDQTIEQRFGFGIDPVQIFDDENERLALTLPEEQALQGVERAAPARRSIEALPFQVIGRDIQQGEDCGYDSPETFVEDDDFVIDLRAYLPHVIVVFNLKVAPEHIRHRQVGRGLAVRDRVRFEDEAALYPVRTDELP